MSESLSEDLIIFVTGDDCPTPKRFMLGHVPMSLFEILAYLGPEVAKLEEHLEALGHDHDLRMMRIEDQQSKLAKLEMNKIELEAEKNRLFRRARNLEDALRDQRFHAEGQCTHGVLHWVGDHCKYDLKILNEHTPWDGKDNV